MSDERADRSDPVLSALRKLKPASLTLTLDDGKERKVAMPKAGNKWQRLSNVLDKLAWDVIDAYDIDGNLLGRIEADEPEPDDERASDESGDERIARLMLVVMEKTQASTVKMFEANQAGTAKLVESMVQGMQSVVDSFKLAMQVQATASLQGGEAPEIMQMMQAAMVLNQTRQQAPDPRTIPQRTRTVIRTVKEPAPIIEGASNEQAAKE